MLSSFHMIAHWEVVMWLFKPCFLRSVFATVFLGWPSWSVCNQSMPDKRQYKLLSMLCGVLTSNASLSDLFHRPLHWGLFSCHGDRHYSLALPPTATSFLAMKGLGVSEWLRWFRVSSLFFNEWRFFYMMCRTLYEFWCRICNLLQKFWNWLRSDSC